ncbi:MAG: Gfo/Idh/MocA family oxidoreductase [Clostridia bacterium]|nr:Gfo/Idh/MocA family oxidoreductase [Clostridia bacterium]
MRVGILGAGNIAEKMALTLRLMKQRGDDVALYAVAARDQARAEAFAARFGFEKAYGSYEEMLCDDSVQLVYVATPHSHHAEHMKLCISHGKNVLCEKAFTANAKQAKEVIALAREKGVLVAEAIWPRYMPSRKMVDDIIASGEIGEVKMVTSNLSYTISHKERIAKPELAGGALLDVGVYALNFALSVLGSEGIKAIDGTAVLTDLGVDAQESFSLTYDDGRMASMMSGIYARTDRRGMVYGTKGFIEVDNVNNPAMISVYKQEKDFADPAVYQVPEQLTGFEYEVEACIRAMENGWLECPEMPHEETIRMMEIMDKLREKFGVHYPFED